MLERRTNVDSGSDEVKRFGFVIWKEEEHGIWADVLKIAEKNRSGLLILVALRILEDGTVIMTADHYDDEDGKKRLEVDSTRLDTIWCGEAVSARNNVWGNNLGLQGVGYKVRFLKRTVLETGIGEKGRERGEKLKDYSEAESEEEDDE